MSRTRRTIGDKYSVESDDVKHIPVRDPERAGDKVNVDGNRRSRMRRRCDR